MNGQLEEIDSIIIRVTVRRLSGKSLQFRVDRRILVEELKLEVAKRLLNVPPANQVLFIGASALSDRDLLSTHCRPGTSELTVTMLSFEAPPPLAQNLRAEFQGKRIY
jgi:hypothetical protein